jgi:hypothetical protein
MIYVGVQTLPDSQATLDRQFEDENAVGDSVELCYLRDLSCNRDTQQPFVLKTIITIFHE